MSELPQPEITAPPLVDTDDRRRSVLYVLLGACALAFLAGLAAWGSKHERATQDATPAAAAPPMQVSAGAVTLAPDAPQWGYVELAVSSASAPLAPLPAPGRITSDEKRTASIGTPLPGRVEQVLVRRGDRVKAGQRLFSVRSGSFAEAERDRAAAEEDVAVKQRLAQRARELLAIKAVPEKDVLSAESELKQAQLTLSAAASKLQALRVTREGENLFWISAPRAGTVIDLAAVVNQEVTPDRAEPLAQIADLDEVLAVADFPEVDVADLKPGAVLSVAPQGGGEARDAVVESVSEVVDPQKRTVEVRARLKNADRAFRPNAFVEATVKDVSQAPRVLVPAEAVVTSGEKAVVFVAEDKGRLVRRPVKTGRQRDGKVEVLAGLAPGTRYVARGALLLLNQVELAE